MKARNELWISKIWDMYRKEVERGKREAGNSKSGTIVWCEEYQQEIGSDGSRADYHKTPENNPQSLRACKENQGS